jgi:hypothetical protein
VIPRLISIWKSNIAASSAWSSITMTGAATSLNNADSNKELDNNNDPIHLFLTAYRPQSFCLATAWRWMQVLGLHYDTTQKNFYVDGHEREDIVANRTAFCKANLTEYEPYCRR